jgi:predicted ATPase
LDYSQGAESEAVRFFQRSAQRIAPQFQLTEADVTAVLDLSQMVDGLPLALEIAAAWTRMMDCPTILRETQKSLDFLASPLGDLPERHQSIRAVLTQSWQMLSAQRQTILAQLACFAGSFTLEAALAIVPNLTMLDMATLLDKSLLHWQPNGRYQMHELLRQFASSQPQKEIETFRENYGRYYLNLVAEQESHLMSHTPQPAITALQKELDNVRQAWRWAVDAISSDLLEAALNGLLAFHEFRGTFKEGCQQFASAAAAMPPADLTNRLQLAQARCLEILGEMEQAIALAQHVVETERSATQLPALIRLARLYERTSQYDEALQTLHTALPLADPLSIEAAKISSPPRRSS